MGRFGGLFRGFFVEVVDFSWIFRRNGGFFVDFRGKSKDEILKLKELQNERLEGSWGALWLGIRTFFGLKLSVVGLQGPKTKS